jgi:zinc transporter
MSAQPPIGQVPADDDGFIIGYDIGPDGSATRLNNSHDLTRNGHWRWLHFDRGHNGTASRLRSFGFFDPRAVDVLLSPETRPSYLRDSDDPSDGATLILRGVNLNPGAAVHEMISLRLFIDCSTIITLRKDRIFAINDIAEAFSNGKGPESPAIFIKHLVDGLTSRITDTVRTFEDDLDSLEERMTMEDGSDSLRENLLQLRRRIIPLRRYVMPQRDALHVLMQDHNSWTTPEENDRMQRAAAETTRIVEALDALRERAGLLQEQIASEIAERMNRNTYALSIVAAIFLPLGFITGLLGINVDGVPGTNTPWAFWAVVIGCFVSAGLVWALMRRTRLL